MENRPDGPANDRGQIIIVTALVIAVTFVGLALVLNSGIYAENLSSRQTTDTDGALSFSLATNETVAEAYERTNAANASNATEARQNFTGIVDSWESSQRQRGAKRGVGVEVERTAHVGWRLNQSADRQFMPAGATGTESWTLVDGASDIGTFRLNVSRTSLYNAKTALNDTGTEAFRLNVSNVSSEWRLYVFQDDDAGKVIVHVGDPDDTYSDVNDLVSNGPACEINADRVIVDLREETLASPGESPVTCAPLDFADDLAGNVRIDYERAYSSDEDRVNGQYSLVVNGSNAVATDGSGYPDEFNAPGNTEPTAQAIVYSASYAGRYGRSDLTHERSGRHMVREETYAS